MAITHILKSNTGKQVVGAVLGMGVAGLIYVMVEQASDMNIKGLLVSTDSITENAGNVATNSTNVDESTLRRLATRAQSVAQGLEQEKADEASPPQAETPITERAAQRGEQRRFESSVASAYASAPTYDVNPNNPITEEQRLAIRTARVSYVPASAAARPFYTATYAPAPTDASLEAVAGVMVTKAPAPTAEPLPDGTHAGAPVATVTAHADALPSSGLGFQLLVTASLLIAGFRYRREIEGRFIAALRAAQ